MICDPQDFWITIAIGYVLAVVTMVVMQDVSDYVRSKRGKLND
tara:strand:- start:653 stop:781 length:129 start_codon:yes stop_codon:yes gene_type:complete